jgi:hypothetical protein
MSKVRSDKHGLYIQTGGYFFRPIFPVGYQSLIAHLFTINVGDTVNARHIGGTPTCKIKVGNQSMYWYSHGCITDRKQQGEPVKSEDCYKPSYTNW